MIRSTERKKTHFGRLLAAYRHHQWLEQTELARQLTGRGYNISASAINRYETGERTPPGPFIYHAALYLELTPDQVVALLEACVADFREELWAEYGP